MREEVENPMIHEGDVHDTVPCNNCGRQVVFGEGTEDEYKGGYFCDEQCFEEWAVANLDVLLEYYKELNVH